MASLRDDAVEGLDDYNLFGEDISFLDAATKVKADKRKDDTGLEGFDFKALGLGAELETVQRLFSEAPVGNKKYEAKDSVSGRSPESYLAGLNSKRIIELLGGKSEPLSGAEKSMLFFLGMSKNASKAGSTFGGSIAGGAETLGTGMLKRVQDIRKFEKESPLKYFELSDRLSKQESSRRGDRSSFRKEWEGSKEVIDMKDQSFALSRLREAASIDVDNPIARGVGDLALVFNFMKLLDPGSVVRESEFRAAAGAGDLGSKIQNFINKPFTGALFTPTIRADFVERAGKFYQGRAKIYKGLYDTRVKMAYGEGFTESEIPNVVPTIDTDHILKIYGPYRKDLEKDEEILAEFKEKQKRTKNLSPEDRAIADKYETDYSSHPKKELIKAALARYGQDWNTLSLERKIEAIKIANNSQKN
tara:strand:- start:1074 stop:2327 length:1254 start_codon:yes stop_codon:yes gene_type:complete